MRRVKQISRAKYSERRKRILQVGRYELWMLINSFSINITVHRDVLVMKRGILKLRSSVNYCNYCNDNLYMLKLNYNLKLIILIVN